MENGKINFSDLFDFNDSGEVNKAVKTIQSLATEYEKLQKHLAQDAQQISQALKSTAAALTSQETQLKSLNVTSSKSQKEITGLAGAIEKTAAAHNESKKTLEGINAAQKIYADSLTGIKTKLAGLTKELNATSKAANPEQWRKLATEIGVLNSQAENLKTSANLMGKALTSAKGSYNALVLENKKLTVELKNLGNAMSGTNPRARELQNQIRQNTEQLKRFDQAMGQSYRNVGNYANSIIEAKRGLEGQKSALTGQLSALNAQKSALSGNAALQDKLQREIKQTNVELQKVNAQLRTYGSEMSTSSGVLTRLGTNLKQTALQFVGINVAFAAMIAGVGKAVSANVELSDTQADVQKSAQLTRKEIEELTNSISKINTRTAINELLEISKVAGQLGVAKTKIDDFTRAIDKVFIALDSDFGDDAEKVATVVAKINNVFKVSSTDNLENSLLRIGSLLNELGNTGAATSDFVGEFALNVGAVASNMKISLPTIAAYAATLQELGFQQEESSTAMSQMLGLMARMPAEFSKFAQVADPSLNLEKFINLINTDAAKAFELFTKGLALAGDNTVSFNQFLGEMKIDGEKAINVITALAKNQDILAQRTKEGANAFKDSQSVLNEWKTKNNNLAAEVDKLGKAFSRLYLSNDFQNALVSLIRGLLTFGAVIKTVYRGVRDNREIFFGLVAAFIGLQSAAGLAAGVIAWNPRSFVAALGINTAAIKANMIALRAWAVALATNPFGLIVAGLAVAIGAFKLFERTSERNLEIQKQLRNFNKQANKDQEETARNLDTLNDKLKKFNSLKEDEQKALLKQIESEKWVARLHLGKLKMAQQDALITAQTINNYDKINAAIKSSVIALGNGTMAAALYNAELGKGQAERTDKVYKETQERIDLLFKEYQSYLDLIKGWEAADRQQADLKANLLKRQEEDLAEFKNLVAEMQRELSKVRLGNKKTALDEYIEDSKAALEIVGENARKAAQKMADDELASNKGVLERKKILNREVGKLNKKQQEEALAAAFELDQKELAAARAKYDELMRMGDITGKRRLDIEKQFIRESEEAATKYFAAINVITSNTGTDPIAAAIRIAAQTAIDMAKLEREIEYANIRKEQKEQEKENTGNAKALEEIEKASHLRRLKADLEFIEKKRAINSQMAQDLVANGVTPLETVDIIGHWNEALAKQQLINQKNYFDEIERQMREAGKRAEEIERARTEFYRAQAETRQAIREEEVRTVGLGIDAMFQIDLEQRQRQIDALGIQTANSLETVKDNEAAKLRIQNRAAEQLKALHVKQAKADKARAAFDIFLNTWLAVMRIKASFAALGPAGLALAAPLIAHTIAQGLITAAVVAARPLPLYAKGRKGGPAEWAIVDEKGPEIIQRKDGLHLGQSKGARVTYLNKGDKVFTAAETQKILKQIEVNKEIRSISHTFDNGQKQLDTILLPKMAARIQVNNPSDIEKHFKSLEKTIKKKKELHLSITGKGISVMAKKGNNWTTYVDNRYKN
jgi:TP901 family phage tail tape measure protein